MRKSILAAALAAIATTAHATQETDWKAAFEKANVSAAAWKARAEKLEAENQWTRKELERVQQYARGLQLQLEKGRMSGQTEFNSPPVGDSEDLQILDFGEKLVESSCGYAMVSWRIVLKGGNKGHEHGAATFRWKDAQGYELESRVKSLNSISPNEQVEVTDTAMIPLDVYAKVKNIEATTE